MKAAVFYHCLFFHGTPPRFRPIAMGIVCEQMQQLKESGLMDSCDEMVVGINGGDESLAIAKTVFPAKARLVMHGLDSKAENLTIAEIEKWAPSHPDWAVLYFHAKGCTHPPERIDKSDVSGQWRREMMQDVVTNWRQCVWDLRNHDIACPQWMWNMADGTQHISAGNFLWVRSSFVAKLPSIYSRARIQMSGIAAAESRYEAEVYWGNGPRPRVKDYRQSLAYLIFGAYPAV